MNVTHKSNQTGVTYKVNQTIVREFSSVIVIDSNGTNLGQMSSGDAYKHAQSEGLDLVLVNASTVPTCKILDYNKMLYTVQKKKPIKKQATSMVRFSIKIDIGDYKNKLSQVVRLLNEGCKVTLTLRARGREMQYLESGGLTVITNAIKDLKSQARVEIPPKIEGRSVNATVAPLSKKK